MDEERIRKLIQEWKEQAEYSAEIGDMSAYHAWTTAYERLEEELAA